MYMAVLWEESESIILMVTIKQAEGWSLSPASSTEQWRVIWWKELRKKRKTNKKVYPAQMQSEECCVPTFGATVSSDGWDSAFEAAVCFPLSVCFRCQWRKFTSSQGHSLDNGLSMPLSTTDFTSVRIRYSELSTRHTLLSDNQNEHFLISWNWQMNAKMRHRAAFVMKVTVLYVLVKSGEILI